MPVQSIRDEKEELGSRTGTRAGTGTRTGTGTRAGTMAGTGTKTGTGAGTEAERGLLMQRKVEGRQSLGTYEVIMEVDRKTRGREATQRGNRKPSPQDLVLHYAKYKSLGRETRDTIGDGGGGAMECKQLQINIDAM